LTSKHTGALSAIKLPVGGRLLVGHVSASDRDNPDVPIPAHQYGPGAFFADARCSSCPAKSELSRKGIEALMLVIHDDGYPKLAAVLTEAGVAR
jgi:hypothetical protein